MITIKKALLPFVLFLTPLYSNAEYIINFKIQEPINFISENETEPTTPEVPEEPAYDLSEYGGVATIESSSGGWVESSNINSQWITKVVIRSYGDHTITLTGKHQDIADHATSVILKINGDTWNCPIYDISLSTNLSSVSCSSNINGNNYSVGQQIEISFH